MERADSIVSKSIDIDNNSVDQTLFKKKKIKRKIDRERIIIAFSSLLAHLNCKHIFLEIPKRDWSQWKTEGRI